MSWGVSGDLGYSDELPGAWLIPAVGCLAVGGVGALIASSGPWWISGLVAAVAAAWVYMFAWRLIWRAEVDRQGLVRCSALVRRVEFRVEDIRRIDVGPGKSAYPAVRVPRARLVASPTLGRELVVALQRRRADIPVKRRRFTLFNNSGG
jgi:hypothetical protein